MNKKTADPEIVITDNQVAMIVNQSVEELLKGQWLSDFLVNENERPVIMVSGIINNSPIAIDIPKVYNTIDMTLAKSGQVRVIKSTDIQRTTDPSQLAKGQSIDYVLSAIFEKKSPNYLPELIITLSLWDDQSSMPIEKVKNEFE